MCLLSVAKRYVPFDPKERNAWKIVYGTDASFGSIPNLYSAFQETSLPIATWMIDKETFPLSTERVGLESYETGFHCYTTLKDAKEAKKIILQPLHYQIIKVKVREIVCEGIDGSSDENMFMSLRLKNVVSKQMFIPQSSFEDFEKSVLRRWFS